MPLPDKDSRAGEPLELIEVGENLTVCIYCDTRTVPDADDEYVLLIGADYAYAPRHEHCPHCGQHYWVLDELPDQ